MGGAADMLALDLGNLPLAVALAASKMRKCDIGCAEYLAAYRMQRLAFSNTVQVFRTTHREVLREHLRLVYSGSKTSPRHVVCFLTHFVFCLQIVLRDVWFENF